MNPPSRNDFTFYLRRTMSLLKNERLQDVWGEFRFSHLRLCLLPDGSRCSRGTWKASRVIYCGIRFLFVSTESPGNTVQLLWSWEKGNKRFGWKISATDVTNSNFIEVGRSLTIGWVGPNGLCFCLLQLPNIHRNFFPFRVLYEWSQGFLKLDENLKKKHFTRIGKKILEM